MKKFNRVLAMLLAIITVLAVLPFSVLAEDWLNVDADKTQNGNVTTTDITVTVDPKALLSYIQDGDVRGFLKGISATGGFGSIMTKEELLAILPEEQIIELAKSIIGDIDASALLACLDADKLLDCVDTEGLISLLKDMDLKSYIKDIDVFMSYVDKKDIESAVSYINTKKLIQKYSKELTELVMGLDAQTLVALVDDEKVLDLFTEDELIDMAISGVITDSAVLKAKLQAKLKNGEVTADQVVACLVNYTAAIKEIGVNNAISAIPGGYKTVLSYVTNFKGLVNNFDVKAIAKGILRDRAITKIIDAKGLINAINVRAFVNKVDVKQLVKVVYESGVAQELLSQLDLESYLVQTFGIIASLQQPITEIEIDGVVVTTQNEEGYLKLLPARLIDSFENLVPTLNELANIDDSGKLFTASFAISYLDGEVEKTKEINFNFVLTAGTDLIRRAAAKLSVMLDKVGYVGLADGKLMADVTVPSEFASVLRIALEGMADSTDPEMNVLKDKVLAAFAARPDDFIAFAQDLTLEEIIAVLEAVDPALFGKVYNKVLTSRYAEVLLAYVERVTGYDFSDNLEAQNLINTLATIPTFEVFVEKLENVTGIEITDRLPAKVNGYFDHTVYEVIDKLGEVAGYDFDMQNLLKAAAASTDPFAYLYTAVVNKAENASGIYNFVKRNSIRVVNRLMATRVGAVIADNCLMDFYAGNSTFVFAKSVTFDAKVLVEKAFSKAIDLVGSRVSAVAARENKLEELFGFALDMILEDTAYMTTGFDISVHVNNLYRVTFQNEDGIVILDTLLPAGTDLSKMLNYNNFEGSQGWINVATGEIVSTMPAADIVVKTNIKEDIEDTTPEETTPEGTTPEGTTPEQPDEPVVPEDKYYNITLTIMGINGEVVQTGKFGQVKEGALLSESKTNLEKKVTTALNTYKKNKSNLSDLDVLNGYDLVYAWDNVDFTAAVTSDIEVVAVISKINLGESAPFQIEGFDHIEMTSSTVVVYLNDDWNKLAADKPLEIVINFGSNTAFKTLALVRDLVITSTADNAQKITISMRLMATMSTKKQVVLTYAKTTNENFAATSGAESYEITLFADGKDYNYVLNEIILKYYFILYKIF